MNRQSMLERRVLRLERLIAERSSKPNLFSKNLNDIKLAIENGESVKSTNVSGKTPLAFAVSSSVDNPEIVEYLLSKGANPNEILNKAPLIFTAIKNNKEDTVLALLANNKTNKAAREDGPRGDMSGPRNIISYACECHKCHNILDKLILDDQIDKFESGEMYWTVNKVCEEYLSYDLPEDVYVKCINKLVGRAVKNGIPASVIINKYKPSAELRIHGTHHLLDLAIENGYWPCWIDDGLSKSKASILYDALVQAIENKLYLGHSIGDVIEVGVSTCKAAKQPISILNDIITSDYLTSMDPWDMYEALRDSQYNAELMSRVIKLRSSFALDDESCNALIKDILNSKVKDSESLKYTYRLLRTFKDDYSPNNDAIELVCKKKNQRMFEFLVDLGFANLFTASDIKLPTSFKNYLKENEIDVDGEDSREDYDTTLERQQYTRLKRLVIKNIINDTWNKDLNDDLNEHPELLQDPVILDAINKNLENSFTARDLKKRAQKEYSKSANIYDM